MTKKTTSEVAGDYSMSGTRRMQAPGNIRSGFQIRGSRGSTFDDAEGASNPDVLPKVALAFLTKGDRILAVSRENDFNNLNMPGGHVEPDEDTKDACVRELWEETGLKADELFPIFTKVHDGRVVTTYKIVSYSGTLSGSPEGEPSWQKPSVLANSQFGDYFKSMLKSLKSNALSESLKLRKV